jgi:hypothetical protein
MINIMKIKDIYNKNQNDEKYLNQIIELYQIIVNLINDKDEIEYINDFDTLYKLGDNNNYLLNVLDIMDSFYAFIQSIDTGHNYDKLRKKNEFKCKLTELKKYYEESKNINLEYFKNDFNDENYANIIKIINDKYNEDKRYNQLTNFCHYIIEKYPPISMSKSIDDFKKNPSLKTLVASYSKSFTKKFSYLKNKEKLREKIHIFLTEMYSDNVVLNSLDDIEDNGNKTDDEGEYETTRTEFSSKK